MDDWPPGLTGVLGSSFSWGQGPQAKLNRKTERGRGTVAADMSLQSVDSNTGVRLWALGVGPTRLGLNTQVEDALPWPFTRFGLCVHYGHALNPPHQ